MFLGKFAKRSPFLTLMIEFSSPILTPAASRVSRASSISSSSEAAANDVAKTFRGVPQPSVLSKAATFVPSSLKASALSDHNASSSIPP